MSANICCHLPCMTCPQCAPQTLPVVAHMSVAEVEEIAALRAVAEAARVSIANAELMAYEAREINRRAELLGGPERKVEPTMSSDYFALREALAKLDKLRSKGG